MNRHIVIFNYREFNVNIGGIERISISLANSLLEKGFKVILVAVLRSKYAIPYSPPVPIHFLPSNDTLSPDNIVEFHKILVDNNVHIVINQDAHSLASHELCHNAIKGTSAKLIAALHFCPSQRLLLYKHPWDRNIFSLKENMVRLLKSMAYKYPFRLYTLRDLRHHFQKMYAESDCVVLLSKNFISEYVCLGGLTESKKIVGINNMLSFPLSNESIDKEKRILFCARMTSEKRPERALYVWAQLQERLSDWTFDFVGDGELLERLKNLSHKLKLRNVEFHGFKDPKPFFKRSRLFLMTSDYEGWGLTITEAMQNKCVPIVMDTYASASEIIDDGENGYLIAKCDCTAMAEKVYELATNENIWKDMSEAAFCKVRQFASEVIVNNWVRLFNEILVDRKESSSAYT